MQHYDAIIVGAGQAGPPLAGRLVEAGQKVALVERNLFGGTCVNTGCIPTKTMIASARAAWMVQRAADFGVMLEGGFHTDMKRVMARKNEISHNSREHLEQWLQSLDGCTIYREHARFAGPKQLSVGEDVISADRIFLDVGGRAALPPITGLDKVPYLDNSSILQTDVLPRHLVIVGAGAIGLEFGQMYRRFGSKVTVISHGPALMEHEDKDVSEAIEDFFSKEGIETILGAAINEAQAQTSGIVVDVKTPQGHVKVTGTHLLMATGRRPNTDDLGLDVVGIETDRHGYIQVDDQLRTNCEGVWAIGECNGHGAFTHTAHNDFQIVVANLLDGETRGLSDRIAAFSVYIDPPLGRAGMNKRQARASGKEVLVARRPMTQVARAREKDETEGFMEALIDARTEKILGATVLGTGGDEIIHSFLDMMYAGAPYTAMKRAVHIHPTVSELIPTMLSDLKPLGATAELAASK